MTNTILSNTGDDPEEEVVSSSTVPVPKQIVVEPLSTVSEIATAKAEGILLFYSELNSVIRFFVAPKGRK